MTPAFFRAEIFSKQPFILRDFYENDLGFKLRYAEPTGSHFEFSIGSFELVVCKSIQEVHNKIRLCFSVEELKPFRHHFLEKNLQASPVKVREGRFFFEMKDPDGNEIVFYQA